MECIPQPEVCDGIDNDCNGVLDDGIDPVAIRCGVGACLNTGARVCLNGHEYAKRQLAKEGIAFEALDNGMLSCADPVRLQQILNEFDETKIEAMVRKWLSRLPDPFTAADHAATGHPRMQTARCWLSGFNGE